MRITLSVEALTPHLTGIGRYTLELARRLAANNAIEDLRFLQNNILKDNLEDFLSESPPKEARTRLSRWLNKRSMVSKIRDGLFHGPNYFLPRFIEEGVITVHDLSVFHFPETHPIERIRHFERDFASSLHRAAHIITDSQTVRKELVEFSGISIGRVTAIPLGVSSLFRPHTKAELHDILKRYGLVPGGYTLCVSTIEPRKKIAELLKAWQQIPRDISAHIPLVIAGGSGWLSDGIQAAIVLGVKEGSVRYLNYIPEMDLPSLYAGAALFVYPSSYEGFGLPPIEAMASGIPTIVSNRSCLPEITQGAAMTVNPDDIETFAKTLEQGLTDQRWRLRAREEGLQVSSKYTWDYCAKMTCQVYQHVMSGQNDMPIDNTTI